MSERLFEEESPADGEGVTVSSEGAPPLFGVVGFGPTGGVVVESLYRLGFDNVLLVGNSDILTIDIPDDMKLVIPGQPPTDMKNGEKQAAEKQMDIYNAMRDRFSKVDRVFVCVGADGAGSAGSTLVMIETAAKVLFDSGKTSGQRIGVIVAYPTAGELAFSKVVNDAKFLVEKLFEFAQKKLIDPLIVTDRANICSLIDGIAAPAEAVAVETNDENGTEEELIAIAEAEKAEDEARELSRKKIDEQNSQDRQARAFARDNVYGE